MAEPALVFAKSSQYFADHDARLRFLWTVLQYYVLVVPVSEVVFAVSQVVASLRLTYYFLFLCRYLFVLVVLVKSFSYACFLSQSGYYLLPLVLDVLVGFLVSYLGYLTIYAVSRQIVLDNIEIRRYVHHRFCSDFKDTWLPNCTGEHIHQGAFIYISQPRLMCNGRSHGFGRFDHK